MRRPDVTHPARPDSPVESKPAGQQGLRVHTRHPTPRESLTWDGAERAAYGIAPPSRQTDSGLRELPADRPRRARRGVDVDVVVLRIRQNRGGEYRVGGRPRSYEARVEPGALEVHHDGTR